MANETIRARIEVLLKGLDQVESLKNAVRQLQGTAAPASADLQKLKNAAMQLGSASGRTENDLRRSINALKDVRAQLGLADVEYRKLTRTINNYQAQLDKATGAQQRAGKGMQFAQTAGAVAASGVFGGVEGLVGAGVGAFFGPQGALAGGAIGAQVGMIRQQLGATATLAADLEKQRTALRLVLKDTAEYNSALTFLSKVSKDYAIPQDRLVKGFTQLAASVKGAGGNIADTKTAFEGVSAGIRGTGGSLENLDAALLATSQVFSKGKVTAEELRGQIGERLPGAFTLFAQSIGKTPQELDKALERGEVGLDDFLKFAKTVFGEYGENAKVIADSPAAAGDRLQTNLKNLGESVGKLLQPVGAAFQDTFSDIVKYIDQAARSLGDFLGLNRSSAERVGNLNNQIIIQQRAIQREKDKLKSGVTTKEAAEYSIREFEARIVKLRSELGVLRGLEKASQQQQKDKPSGLGGTGGGGKTDPDRQALSKLENERLRKEAEEQKTNESIAKNRIALDDTVNRNAMELIRKRYEYEQELINKQRDNWVKSQTGAARSAAGLISGFFGEIQKIQDRVLEAQDKVASAQQALKSAKSMAATTTGGSGAISATSGMSFSATQLQSAAREASKFTGIANMCSESVKAFYKSLGITLPGVTAWADTVRNAGKVMTDWSKLQAGDIVATGRPGDTPHVGVYTGGNNVFHQSRKRGLTAGNYPDLDYFKSGYFVRPGGMAGGAAGAAGRRDINAEGSVEVMNANLQRSQQELKLAEENVKKLKAAVGEGFVLDFTDEIRQQNAALKESAGITGLRNRLELEGVRPELIDSRVRQAEAAQLIAQKNGIATQALKALTDAGEENSLQAQRLRDGIAGNNYQLSEFTRLTNEATAAQIAFNDAMRFRQDNRIGLGLQEGAQSYIESIGTMREATAQLAQTGIRGVEDALMSLATTGKANFREFAADMLKQTARMIIQQMILRVLLQAVGAIGGGLGGGGGGITGNIGSVNFNPNAFSMPSLLSANGNAFAQNGIVPYAKGGVVNSPTLFKFAKGGSMATGLMGEAGPEAILPLKRGPNGKLGVQLFADGGVIDRRRDEDRLFRRGMRMNPRGSGVAGGRVSNGADKASLFADFVENPYKLIRATGGDALAKTKWGQSLGNYFNKAAADFASIPASSSLGAIGKYSANIFSQVAAGVSGGEPTKYAKGGVVNSPTLFKFANGGTMQSGLMGEAGPEAIMPLRRGRDGKLGVAGGGSGPVVVNVSVDASGSSVQGDAGRGDQLGQAMAQAVQAELIRQKRPGGLLAA